MATTDKGIQFRERAELLDFLLEVSRVTAETLDLDEQLAAIATIVKEVIPYDLFAILPELLVIFAACAVLVLDPITPSSRKDGLAWLSLGTMAVCMGLTAARFGSPTTAFGGLVVIDNYSCFWKLLLYFVTGLTILLSFSYLKEERICLGEYYGFILLALSGMMVMVSGADLLTIYLGTELMSLSLYVMAGLKRAEAKSLEASAKYFVLGALAAAGGPNVYVLILLLFTAAVLGGIGALVVAFLAFVLAEPFFSADGGIPLLVLVALSRVPVQQLVARLTGIIV